MATPPSVITKEELRAQIGGPTTDSAEPGFVTDQMLQDIIDRNTLILENIAFERLDEGKVIPMDDFEPVAIDMEPSGFAALVSFGELDKNWFPSTTVAVDDVGEQMNYDRELFTTASTTPFSRRRFKFVGRRVFATPRELEGMTVFVPSVDTAIASLAADLIADFNDKIIQEAAVMLASRIAEQTRLVNPDRDS